MVMVTMPFVKMYAILPPMWTGPTRGTYLVEGSILPMDSQVWLVRPTTVDRSDKHILTPANTVRAQRAIGEMRV